MPVKTVIPVGNHEFVPAFCLVLVTAGERMGLSSLN